MNALVPLHPGLLQVDSDRLLLLCFGIFIPCVLIWISAVTAFSVFRRLRSGKPLFRPRFQNARYSERWRSGRSLKPKRWGGAENCLWVTITDEELVICPHFPFNLMFMPERLHLEHRIKGSDILLVEHRASLFGGARVSVTFLKADGTEGGFEIAVRDPAAFEHAIDGIRDPNATPAPSHRLLRRDEN